MKKMEIISKIDDVEFKLKQDDEWRKGSAVLVKNAVEGEPLRVAAYCHEQGEETAHFAYAIRSKDKDGNKYIINVNNIMLKGSRVSVQRIKVNGDEK